MNTRVKGLKISQIPELKELTGDEMIPYQYKCTNGKISTGTLKKYIEVNASATDLTEVNNQIAELTKTTETLNENKQDKGDYALKSDIPDVDDFVTNNDLNGKQDTLVSGENIKTINGVSILGEGNVLISEGGSPVIVENDFGDSTENPSSQALVTRVNSSVSALNTSISALNTTVGNLDDNLNTTDAKVDAFDHIINTIADEEDLTIINTVRNVDATKQLKFADKNYNTTEFSGIGRVYLRKNIINGKNILIQLLINKENTRYIILYDYDLNGLTINVPNGCVFDFSGGSFSNGKFVFNNTFIVDNNVALINIKWIGTLKNRYVNVKWFGAKGDNITDDSDAFRNAMRSEEEYTNANGFGLNYGVTIYVPAGNYQISKTLFLRTGNTIIGAGPQNTIISFKICTPCIKMGENTQGIKDTYGPDTCVSGIYFAATYGGDGIYTNGVPGFEITNCWFNCNKGIWAYGVDGRISRCVQDLGKCMIVIGKYSDEQKYDPDVQVGFLNINNCDFTLGTDTNIEIWQSRNINISNCTFQYTKNSNIKFTNWCYGINISNCCFRNSLAENYYSDDHVSILSVNSTVYDLNISNCYFDQIKKYAILLYNSRATITGCSFVNSTKGAIFFNYGKNIINGNSFTNIKSISIALHDCLSIVKGNMFFDTYLIALDNDTNESYMKCDILANNTDNSDYITVSDNIYNSYSRQGCSFIQKTNGNSHDNIKYNGISTLITVNCAVNSHDENIEDNRINV